MLLDRVEGKVVQTIGNEDGSPLIVSINVNSDDTKRNIADVINRLSS